MDVTALFRHFTSRLRWGLRVHVATKTSALTVVKAQALDFTLAHGDPGISQEPSTGAGSR
jgi:hypothetical protein